MRGRSQAIRWGLAGVVVLAAVVAAWAGWVSAVAIGVLAILVLAGAGFLLLHRYINPTTAEDKRSYVQTIAQIVGGVGLALGLLATWNTLQINLDTLELGQKALLAERYTRATDQLGSVNSDGAPMAEVRVGGIYALEQIVAESVARDGGEYYWPVMDMLTAYLRAYASVAGECSDVSPVMRPDIQAILAVIGRRPYEFEAQMAERFGPRYLNLNSTDLRDANLNGMYFRHAFFRDADLTRAFLNGTNIQEARMTHTTLANAHLAGVDGKGAILQYANLENADLQRANLEEAHLEYADLTGAVLSNANLRGAVLQDAILTGVNLSNADLAGADLEDATLADANLEGADLRGARLSGVRGLTQEQLDVAIIDGGTDLPNFGRLAAYATATVSATQRACR